MCLREHDRKFRFHVVMGADQRAEWTPVGIDREGPCRLHPERLREMVCMDHGDACCALCVASLHK